MNRDRLIALLQSLPKNLSVFVDGTSPEHGVVVASLTDGCDTPGHPNFGEGYYVYEHDGYYSIVVQ